MAASREVALRNLALADKANRSGKGNRWREIQTSLADVYFHLGGTQGLIDWVNEDKTNKRDFYNHICRSLGSKVEINLQGSQVLIVLDDMDQDSEPDPIPIENGESLE